MNETISEDQCESATKRLERSVALLRDRIRLLEDENTRFVDMLAARGVEARHRSKMSLELPSPISDTADGYVEAVALMSGPERQLLSELVGGEKPLLLLKSGSRADVGAWFRKSSVWVCALPKQIVLFAAGRKPFSQKIPFSFLGESMYNHVTGEVVFAPAQGLSMRSVKLPPMDGYQLLAQIYGA